MDIKPAGRIPYTEKQFNDYKARLANSLLKDAIDTIDIQANSEYKNFIANYVQMELADKDSQHMIAGITHKFAHTDIESSAGRKTYPIINVYKGHHLQKTIYFKKDELTKVISANIVEVNPTKMFL